MQPDHKYARIERERRFLLDRFPSNTAVERTRHIDDRYINGTSLRLRRMSEEGGPTVFKLTQKIPMADSSPRERLITTIYLTEDEFRIFAQLPAMALSKSRYSVPPFGIDVFKGMLAGLILAEAEFRAADPADTLDLPSFIISEVTADDRFTGGRLVCASPGDLRRWLSEYGIGLP